MSRETERETGESGDTHLTPCLVGIEACAGSHDRVRAQDERVLADDRKITALAKQSEAAQRRMAIEGGGPLTATALGRTPRQNSSGGKTRLGSISKRGDVTPRSLLIHGTRSALQRMANWTNRKSQRAEALKARTCNNVAAVALAAKHARIIWTILARRNE